jgi:hypothetical protein
MLAVLLLAAACKKDKNKISACGVENPVVNLPWLKHTIDSFVTLKQGGNVVLVKYNGQDYINVQQNLLSCWPCGLHTCAGKRLAYPGDSALISNIAVTAERKLIYTFGN